MEIKQNNHALFCIIIFNLHHTATELVLPAWRYLIAVIQSAVSCSELYFAHCCAMKWSGTFASQSKVMCLFSLILRSVVLMYHS